MTSEARTCCRDAAEFADVCTVPHRILRIAINTAWLSCKQDSKCFAWDIVYTHCFDRFAVVGQGRLGPSTSCFCVGSISWLQPDSCVSSISQQGRLPKALCPKKKRSWSQALSLSSSSCKGTFPSRRVALSAALRRPPGPGLPHPFPRISFERVAHPIHSSQ